MRPQARTPLLALVDVDMLLSKDIYNRMLDPAQAAALTEVPHVLNIPA